MWCYRLLLSALLCSTASGAFAAESGLLTQGGDAAVPTTITAKKMTVRNVDRQAIFEGTVVLTRGSLQVYSDKMVVLFHSTRQQDKPSVGEKRGGEATVNPVPAKDEGSAKPAASSRALSQVEATGHVKIVKENGNATCGKALYSADEEVITLTDNPVAWEHGTRVSGKKITIFLKEERSVVEGGSHVRIEGEGKNTP
jgi:lipopolysaccharide export system protein LptA